MPFISASVISPYNSIRGGAAGPAGTLLLDLYPNAAAAYSLRKLSTAYTGSAIEVRKTVAGETFIQDIGFVDNELDTVSLLSFAEGGDVFVAKWYDQSGGTVNDAVQVSESTQPKIVSSGSVILDNEKPAISFNSDFLQISLISSDTEASIISICNPNELTTYNTIFGNGNNNGYALTVDSTKYNLFYRGVADQPTLNNANFSQSLIFAYTKSNTNQTLYSNNVLFQDITPPIMKTPTISSRIGAYDASQNPFNGEQQELIIYPSDQTANRAGIESNINKNYNIYWDGSQTGLLDDYPSAVAAYSLRALSSEYTGAAIRVRRSSDDAEQDINLLYDGSLDTESLLSFVGAGDGFVTKRYDQSGNGNDLTNISASAQPKIVLSGQIITENQKPMIDYDGENHYLKTSNGLNFGTSSRSLFLVQKTDVVGFALGRFSIATSTEIASSWAVTPEIYVRASSRVWAGQVSTPTTSTSLISNIYTSGNLVAGNSMWLDGSSITQSGSKDGNINTFNDPMMEGARGEGIFLFDGKIGDTIIYKSDQSANRAGIEANINNHYTIY